ncbi:MAG: chromosomal replication initiator protein DnaA [Candidatus Omnitrophica bacterium]|nr:chromosomal replication initiator protein DnaA [Candidatus Omnitrophota bacterium]MCM8825509.1 chromosomal replication initiator protein DnaA [Candidatus Omnitrophota bacterium]
MNDKVVDNLWKIWETVLIKLGNRLQNDRVIDTWFKPLKIHKIEGNTVYIEIPGPIFYKGLAPFLNIFSIVLEEVLEKPAYIQWIMADAENLKQEQPPYKDQNSISCENMNPDYIFENFVVGPCNRLAHAASLAVAQSPGVAYNPLFIYGDVGLGKTHLMQAIGHAVYESSHGHVAYLPCEIFVNQFIHSIQTKTTHLFRNRFRKADILLIDDIHFLAGKEGTQEEFFHTFNALYDQRKQIVLSSDKPPKEISDLEKRLVSRFEWGLVVDLQPPDFETRVAILKKKCETKRLHPSDDVIFYIAENITGNIRLLEGALNRLFAISSLFGKDLNVDVAKEYLKEIIYSQKKIVTIQKVIDTVADYFRISLHDLKSQRRVKDLVVPRQIAMYLARELTASSLTSIAEEFGGKDHTTVIHACKKVKASIEKDENLKAVVEKLIERLNT